MCARARVCVCVNLVIVFDCEKYFALFLNYLIFAVNMFYQNIVRVIYLFSSLTTFINQKYNHVPECIFIIKAIFKIIQDFKKITPKIYNLNYDNLFWMLQFLVAIRYLTQETNISKIQFK